MHMTLFRSIKSRTLLGKAHLPMAVALFVSCGGGAPPAPKPNPPALKSEPVHLPTLMPDPAEPVNRGIWAFNRCALESVVHPIGWTYRKAVPAKVRESIGHMGINLLFPGRLVNEVLQGRWKDAGNETTRFVTNSTVGVGGLFDVASKWQIPAPSADFSQTFQKWGWKPHTYLMLPLLGPSDDSNLAASAFNRACDPLVYIDGTWPVNAAFSAHRITDSSSAAIRITRSQPDSYSFAHLAWSYMNRHDSPDWTVHGKPDIPSLETMAAAAIRLENPAFADNARTGRAVIPSTGRTLPYSYWMQKNSAPLAYLLPGLGSHRYSSITLAIAEHLHASGFSVVALASSFHPEFFLNASTSRMPGNLHKDTRDIWHALEAIDAQLSKRFEGKITKRAMVGASLGGFTALTLANEHPGDSSLRINRYLAINPPVDLAHSVEVIDSFFQTPLHWPQQWRQQRIDNAVHKVGGLAAVRTSKPNGPLFDGNESKYLIGLNFRYTLRDALFAMEDRHRIGLAPARISQWNRKAVYDELLGISFSDYAYRMMIPHHMALGTSKQEFLRHRSLINQSAALRSRKSTCVITNRNDFLLRPEDGPWLRDTFGPSRIIVLPNGGHLGNVASQEVRSAISKLLQDLH